MPWSIGDLQKSARVDKPTKPFSCRSNALIFICVFGKTWKICPGNALIASCKLRKIFVIVDKP